MKKRRHKCNCWARMFFLYLRKKKCIAEKLLCLLYKECSDTSFVQVVHMCEYHVATTNKSIFMAKYCLWRKNRICTARTLPTIVWYRKYKTNIKFWREEMGKKHKNFILLLDFHLIIYANVINSLYCYLPVLWILSNSFWICIYPISCCFLAQLQLPDSLIL